MSSVRPPLSQPADASLLTVDIRHRAGPLRLDVQFDLTHPWTVLFGPSGSGKSTILRAIAGFIEPGAGRIVLNSTHPQILFDRAAGVSLPTHLRPIRIAAQKTWLFPGTVRRNILHGVQAPTGERRGWVQTVLDRFHLQRLAAANVDTLSGGERQRVALARLYASTFAVPTHNDSRARPLLLLDEPFTGMDTALRDSLATDLRNLFAEENIPVLSVTHDIGEAFLLNAEIIRIAEGRIVTQGPPAKVLAEERTRLLAQLTL